MYNEEEPRALYDAMVRTMKTQLEHEQRVKGALRTRFDDDFAKAVGCNTEVMDEIDREYDLAEQEHLARVRAIDARFGAVCQRRAAYLQRLLDDISRDERTADTLRRAAGVMDEDGVGKDVLVARLKVDAGHLETTAEQTRQMLFGWYTRQVSEEGKLFPPAGVPAELIDKVRACSKVCNVDQSDPEPVTETVAGSFIGGEFAVYTADQVASVEESDSV